MFQNTVQMVVADALETEIQAGVVCAGNPLAILLCSSNSGVPGCLLHQVQDIPGPSQAPKDRIYSG